MYMMIAVLKAEQSASVKAVCWGCLYWTTTSSQMPVTVYSRWDLHFYQQATVVACGK